MNNAILIRLNGDTVVRSIQSSDSTYYFDNEDGAMYRRSDSRYDSVMGGWWVTYVEQKPVC